MNTPSANAAHLHHEGFTAILKTDLSNGITRGHVLNTEPPLTFEGRTLPELRHAFADAVNNYRARTGQAIE
jgi:hypothetical protein